jgi:hypothetical protein
MGQAPKTLGWKTPAGGGRREGGEVSPRLREEGEKKKEVLDELLHSEINTGCNDPLNPSNPRT